MKRSIARGIGPGGALSVTSLAVTSLSVAFLAVAFLAVAGCSGPGADGPSSSGRAAVTFWGWAPGYADAVEAFNRSHLDIEVTYQAVRPGAEGGYQKLLDAVKAGNAPCLAQIGYETLPSFAAQGALLDVGEHRTIAQQAAFPEAAWSAVTVEEQVHGVPVDMGPMALFYNKKVFDALGLEVPTTWAEYRTAARTIHASDPRRFISSPYMTYDYAGLARQAGASWFGVKDDVWQVTMASRANEKVAAYWQSLVDEGLISSAPMYDRSWYEGLGDGDIATVVGAVWQAGVIKSGAKDGAGQWAVAPMPQWDEGQIEVGNAGGGATAVLKGCENPAAAWEFAHWMSTDRDAFGVLVEKAARYPAATDLLDLPQLAAADPYFGGQKIYDVFSAASHQVNPDWTWGPLMTKTATDLDDGLRTAWSGQGTIYGALRDTQDRTVAAMREQELEVTS
ncbi:ABC transporter substrate-binding protein [Streptomyces sp. enrichment culture]|uniref:ABC transporter substrate-binding protein n=1 Tax=Streptomyces sp. enrichment culture TaxID=1795815 RepID=UPI003F577D51